MPHQTETTPAHCGSCLDGDGSPSPSRRVFYIFTIIANCTHQIIIFRMTPTTIPAERSLTYNLTTFAHVASHAAMTRWRPVSSVVRNVHPTPDLLFSLPLRQLGSADALTTKWTLLVRFISHLWQALMDPAHLIRNGPARPSHARELVTSRRARARACSTATVSSAPRAPL